MKATGKLYYVPLGEFVYELPRSGETLEQAAKRLSRLARSYAAQGRWFRVEVDGERVLWWRVEPRRNTKLAFWYALPSGETLLLKSNASSTDLRAARETARYLRRKGAGEFQPRLVDGDLFVSRL